MERYKNFVRIEQMKEHIRSGRTDRALELAEMLDPASIKSSSDLNIMADLYLESGMLAKAGECLGVLYERKKTRSVLMQLINLNIRLKKTREAEKYYREFKALAPGDFYNYIFRYNIDKIEGKPYETLIESLEKLKAVEYIESWAYELAKLYHKAGDREKCISECDDIEVWFGEGEYVDRARALKAYYTGSLDLDSQSGQDEPAQRPALKVEFETELKYKCDMQTLQESEGDLKEIVPLTDETPESDDDMKIVEQESISEPADEPEASEEPEELVEPGEPEASEETEELEEDVEPEETEEPKETAEPEETEESVETVEFEKAEEVEEPVRPEETAEFEKPEEPEETAKPENAAEPEELAEPEVSGESGDVIETEMTLDDFDEDEITLAPEVLAAIDGVGADDYEAPAVNISGIEPESIPMDDKRAELEAFESEATVRAEIVHHEFRGLKSADIPKDGFLEQFLTKHDSDLENYFGFFAYQSETRAQLIRSLDILLNPQIKNINIVISGERDNGVNNITRGIAKILYQSGYLKSGQIAFTDADKINAMKLTQKTDKLMGCCLSIASAGRLNSEAAKELLEADKVFAGKTAVVLTDYRSEINRLLRDNRDLNSIFPQRIHVPDFDADDLTDLAFVRFNKEGYSIEKPAYDLMIKEMRSIARENGGKSLKTAEKYIEMIADVVETRKAKSFMAGNFEMSDATAQNVITAEDVKAAKQ